MGKQKNDSLLEWLRKRSDEQVALIVTVKGSPDVYVPELEKAGLTVKRTFSLTRKLALSGPARAFLALRDKEWVAELEEDRTVRSMS